MGRVVSLGSLSGIIVNTLAQNARDVGSVPTLGTIFPIFITLTTLVMANTRFGSDKCQFYKSFI